MESAGSSASVDHFRFMRRAIELARHAVDSGEGRPFGAVIVRNGQVIAEGWNRSAAESDTTAHAEMVAIRLGCRGQHSLTLDGSEMYASAQPCPMCTAAIYLAGMKAVYFGTSYEEVTRLVPELDVQPIAAALTHPWDQRPIPESRLLVDEARRVFEDYAKRAGGN